MNSIDSHREFLEAFASAYVNDGFMEDEGDEMLDSFMKMKGSFPLILAEVRNLKDEGNRLFRQNNFDSARMCYDEACKLLSLGLGNIEGEDIHLLSDLAVSLISNMAACALKLEKYRAASGLCSMILATFPRNVKALFRRAVASIKLKRFSKAKLDLVEASVVDPSNKDVLRELEVVKGHLLLKENGKRMLEGDTKEDCMEGNSKKSVRASTFDVGIKDSESVVKEVIEDQSNVSVEEDESVNMEDQNKVSVNEDESVNMEMTEGQGNSGMDSLGSLKQEEHISNNSVLEFSNKGGGNSKLRIPLQSYEKLLDGKKVCFHRKWDLSTLTVRIRIRIPDVEVMKETVALSEQGRKKRKKKKRRSCSKKRKSKKMMEGMNKDQTPSHIINVAPKVSLSVSSTSAMSLSAPSICDNVPPRGTHLLNDNTRVVVNDSSGPVSLAKGKALLLSSQNDSLIQETTMRPFYSYTLQVPLVQEMENGYSQE